MEFVLLGWPTEGPTLDLDHERFAYAGKFVMSTTGKAVAREADDVVAAAAFDPDRTDDRVLRIRYITVRVDRRGERIGPRLLAFVCRRADQRGFDSVRIAVNNPFAYEACYRAGFGFTGEETGLAELVLAWPSSCRRPADYAEGLDRFRDRELQPAEASFLADAGDSGPPDVIDPPDSTRRS